MNLSIIKKKLSECHVSPNDRYFRTVAETSNEEYLKQRALECINTIDCTDDRTKQDEQIRLAIQLLNLLRCKLGEEKNVDTASPADNS